MASASARLLNAFANQVETMRRLRSKREVGTLASGVD
jgi:hypothetical protein